MLPLMLACLWIVIGSVIAMFPSKRHHWPAAYVLMALGLPLAAWIWVEVGALAVLGFALAAGSLLRWPIRYFLRWLGRLVRRRNLG